jgi:GTPase SAR1 family protein
MYYNDVQGVLVCFDLTDEESFSKLNFWLQDLQRHAPENIVKFLVGLKSDLVTVGDANMSVSESLDFK